MGKTTCRIEISTVQSTLDSKPGERKSCYKKRLVLIFPQENPTKWKNKESRELNPPFFLSSSNTIWIDSTGSFPDLRLREWH